MKGVESWGRVAEVVDLGRSTAAASRRAPKAARFLGLVMLLLVSGIALAAGEDSIPERPEKLTYPPLTYEPPAPAVCRVALKSGPVAYVVPDRELPLLSVVVYVRTGQYVEPAGKEGLADLTGYLLAHGGTKGQSAEDFEERLAFLAANLSAEVGETQGRVSLNLLSKDTEEGLAILREVLSAPRLQDDKVALRKQQILQEMKQRNDDSKDIEEREKGFLVLGENFWANRYSTAASIASITHGDIEAFHQRWFCPANFVLAVSGDFDRDTMVQKLEALFANWPYAGETPPPIPTNTAFAAPGCYLVDKEVNQGRVDMMVPGLLRDNPDYFPAMVMNDILGGGGFTSHLVNRIRSDEGLAYHAFSQFPGGVYYPLAFTAGFQSKSRTVAFAASIVAEEMQKMAAAPPAESELNISKHGFVERFPRAFSTKAQVASTFALDEFTGRYAKDPNYWKEYRNRVQAVTAADVQRVAQKYLVPDKMVMLIVGQKDDILLGHPDHPVKLTDLVKGPLVNLPLRDPLTMKPMAAAASAGGPGEKANEGTKQ